MDACVCTAKNEKKMHTIKQNVENKIQATGFTMKAGWSNATDIFGYEELF